MGSLFTSLFAKIAAVVKWFSDLFIAIFVAIWDLLKDIFSWFFEQILDVSLSMFQSIDTSGLASLAQIGGGWSSLPAELLNILQLIGVGIAFEIIAAAIAIRLLLQLVPFTRLGS